MDFLGKNGNGLIIDFTTGLAASSLDDKPEVFHLLQNQKGHFLLDVCEYLTRGRVLEGHTLLSTAVTTLVHLQKFCCYF